MTESSRLSRDYVEKFNSFSKEADVLVRQAELIRGPYRDLLVTEAIALADLAWETVGTFDLADAQVLRARASVLRRRFQELPGRFSEKRNVAWLSMCLRELAFEILANLVLACRPAHPAEMSKGAPVEGAESEVP